MVENIGPILRVEDLHRSIEYYISQLGFTLEWQDEFSAGLKRDKGGLMLIWRSQGHAGTYVWVGVQDVRAVYSEFLATGAIVRHPPLNYPWALEMKVEDPDGHVLRFGSNPVEGQPFDEWRD